MAATRALVRLLLLALVAALMGAAPTSAAGARALVSSKNYSPGWHGWSLKEKKEYKKEFKELCAAKYDHCKFCKDYVNPKCAACKRGYELQSGKCVPK